MNKGIITTYVLVFGAIFLILLGGLLSFILLQLKVSRQRVAWADSLYIAETGINYYKWHLNHTPKGENPDIQDGNSWCCKVGEVEYSQDDPQCQEGDFTICGVCDDQACYEHPYQDAEGKSAGKFVLKIKAKKICGRILGVYVTSIGSTKDYPDLERKVQIKLAATSIADYAYLLNDSVWAGSDQKIYGKYHCNGGIRMDGTHNSLVTSATVQWDCTCTKKFGCCSWNCPDRCEPSVINCKCQGVCGGGGPKDLWKKVSRFPFGEITQDLNEMKNLATSSGKYYPPSTEINSNGKGYHVIFNKDGSFDIKVVTELEGVYASDTEKGQHWSYEKISDEYYPSSGIYDGYNLEFDNVSTPSGCGLIFVEDQLWVEGEVKGKKTIASANLIDSAKNTTTYLNGNIKYTTLDGSDSLAVITEKDVLIPCYSPDPMTIQGVFLAQKGYFGRKRYFHPDDYVLLCKLPPNRCEIEAKKDKLTVHGTIVSKGQVDTKQVNIFGTYLSGYKERENYFDEKLSRDPPPLLPYVSEEMEIISWEEL